MAKRIEPVTSLSPLEKVPTGIQGLDEITYGGFPKNRPTLICGSAGAGKTLLGVEFLYRGATEFDEPGVFMSFEETTDEIGKNVASLGFDLDELVKKQKLAMDFVYIERSEIQETGEYDLEGLFVRLNYAIESVKAKRVVLDTLEALFSGMPNHAVLRAELRRLFRWLKEKKVTAVITAERGESSLTRYGLEEYVADCVVILDHRVVDQVSTRRLRVVKYRGTIHGTNEYPFIITESGFSVLPITSVGLDHEAATRRVSTGIPRLDTMLGGKGYFQGSSILVSGTAGSGKSTLAASFADAACSRGERVLYLAFEESAKQIERNMASVGIDLRQWQEKGLLLFHNSRPTASGLETHLAILHKLVGEFDPSIIITDPITNLLSVGNEIDTRAMLTRMIDFLKSRQITALFTSLTAGNGALEQTEVGISSLMDTWILLKMFESNGERNRGIYILKSRGMNHSNQVREFTINKDGINIVDVYVGQEGVLMGTARMAQEARERLEEETSRDHQNRKEREAGARMRSIQAQIAALQAELEGERNDLDSINRHDAFRTAFFTQEQEQMAIMRSADAPTITGNGARTKVGKGKKR